MGKFLAIPAVFIAACIAGVVGAVLLVSLLLSGSDSAGDSSAVDTSAASAKYSSVPPLYLKLCQAAAAKEHIRWNVLCGVIKAESQFGKFGTTNPKTGVNSAGAAGPCQIGIGGRSSKTWQSESGLPVKLVFRPEFCIPVAAKILANNGATKTATERQAVFAYNHGANARYSVFDGYTGVVMHYAASFIKSQLEAGSLAATGRAAAVLKFGEVLVANHTPYVWGGIGINNAAGGFDCSGLTSAAYQSVGVNLPRTADMQYHAVPHVSTPQPGDLLFFGYGHIHHVGLFYKRVGNRWWMLDAPHTGANLRIEMFKDGPRYVNGWGDYAGAGRP